MKGERFYDFVVGIHHLDKYIKAIESAVAQKIGVKGVHIFMIYSLADSPSGLTASEIARKNGNNRSLISREIEKLCSNGIVRYDMSDEKGKKYDARIVLTEAGSKYDAKIVLTETGRKYNAKIVLTEKGKEIAKSFSKIGIEAQDKVRGNISMEELAVFYSVLERMTANIEDHKKTKQEEL